MRHRLAKHGCQLCVVFVSRHMASFEVRGTYSYTRVSVAECDMYDRALGRSSALIT